MLNVWYFFQGYGRIFLLKYAPLLLRCSIRDEYLWRLGQASRCVKNRECYACGCRTPALMMADKACSAPEYLKEGACYLKMKSVMLTSMQLSGEWERQVIDLGKIEKGKSYFATFIYNGKKFISDVSPSCGCTTSEHDTDSITLKLSYKKWDPRPLAHDIIKHAAVTFSDGSTDTIKIIGKGA